MRFLSRLFKPSKSPVPTFRDSALGLLTYDAESEAWTKTVVVLGASVKLSVAGDDEPHSALLQRAAIVEGELTLLTNAAPGFLLESAKGLPLLANEIAGLTISEVAVWWPKDLDTAMVWFDGGREGRIWHCSYAAGTLSNLAFDD